MVQEEDRDDGVVAAFRPSALFEAGIGDAEPRGIFTRLPHRRRGEIDTHYLAHVRRQQQFGIADAASQAQNA